MQRTDLGLCTDQWLKENWFYRLRTREIQSSIPERENSSTKHSKNSHTNSSTFIELSLYCRQAPYQICLKGCWASSFYSDIPFSHQSYSSVKFIIPQQLDLVIKIGQEINFRLNQQKGDGRSYLWGNTHRYGIQLPKESLASNIISTWQNGTILCKWIHYY